MYKRVGRLDQHRLRLYLAGFFLALAMPTALLVERAYSQARWEALHQQQVLAEELLTRLDSQLVQRIQTEEARTFADYAFLVVAGDPAANFVERSPLSAFPVRSELPGLLGYFQIDAGGQFSSPLLPRDLKQAHQYGIVDAEYAQRQTLVTTLQEVLLRNRLVSEHRLPASPAPAVTVQAKATAPAASKAEGGAPLRASVSEAEYPSAQSAFDKLKDKATDAWSRTRSLTEESKAGFNTAGHSEGRAVSDTASRKAQPPEARSSRKEQSAIAEAPVSAELKSEPMEIARQRAIRVTTFESEVDPFDLSRLGSGHFVLFRKVWRQGQRYIQGALIEQGDFVRRAIEQSFLDTALAAGSRLRLLYAGEELYLSHGLSDASDANLEQGMFLYRGRLSAPLSDIELVFSAQGKSLAEPNTKLIAWLAAVLTTILCGGTYLLYRLGARQIALATQQQDFISAVSHELKTPLTSIRMYGEMLREGWVQEDKKPTYYDFIYSESERLSRLINNVLQLARMTRQEYTLELKPVPVVELMDILLSKISTQITQAGFELDWRTEELLQGRKLDVETDAAVQIMINLIDNAIKFSAKATTKKIDVTWRLMSPTELVLSVRDYGPGLPKDQMKKIFRLFYRLENELTRETTGTGIGLALVQQLAHSMRGRIEVLNANPGAEFRVCLPLNQ